MQRLPRRAARPLRLRDVPFLLDMRGAWGTEVCAWLQAITADLPVDERRVAVAGWRRLRIVYND